jgi:hypothetical protein
MRFDALGAVFRTAGKQCVISAADEGSVEQTFFASNEPGAMFFENYFFLMGKYKGGVEWKEK